MHPFAFAAGAATSIAVPIAAIASAFMSASLVRVSASKLSIRSNVPARAAIDVTRGAAKWNELLRSKCLAQATPAARALEAGHVSFTVHEYDYDPGRARIGLQAAGAAGVSPGRLLKALMARAGGEIVCVLVPSDREV